MNIAAVRLRMAMDIMDNYNKQNQDGYGYNEYKSNQNQDGCGYNGYKSNQNQDGYGYNEYKSNQNQDGYGYNGYNSSQIRMATDITDTITFKLIYITKIILHCFNTWMFITCRISFRHCVKLIAEFKTTESNQIFKLWRYTWLSI